MKRPFSSVGLGVVMAAAISIAPSDGLEAQTCPLAPGCRATIEESVPFEAADRSLWGPGGRLRGDQGGGPMRRSTKQQTRVTRVLALAVVGQAQG